MTRPWLPPIAALLLAVGGCGSTTSFRFIPAPQEPVCSASATGAILWRTQWRADQKDALAREAAAAAGLSQFLESAGCFKSASLARTPPNAAGSAEELVAEAMLRSGVVVLITVRELGPTVKIGASLALVEGATEVVLDVSEFLPGRTSPRTFTVHWRSGGPGVLKGVASLPQDMQAALVAGLQPGAQ